jgi:recombination protein RecA
MPLEPFSQSSRRPSVATSAPGRTALARAELESLLRTRQLDRTLTTALPGGPDTDLASTGIAALDARVGGGLPRGHISEVVGPRSSGRTSLTLQMLTAATARGELVALVDALDMFDVESAAAAGIDLARLLWVRGHVVSNPGLCRDMNQRALEQAIRALALILQAGNFGLVVFDAAEAPPDALRRLPFTTWLRLQRMVEGSQTTCVLVGGDTMARSSAGLTLRTGIRDWGLGIRFGQRLFEGLDIQTRVVRARARANEEAAVTVATAATNCA